MTDRLFQPLDYRAISGLSQRRNDSRHVPDEPVQERGRRTEGPGDAEGGELRRARRRRRRGHVGSGRPALRRARVPGRGGPEDDRQRSLRHGLHIRLRHGGLDRNGGDRSVAHDGRVPQPRDGRRGDGTPHRVDRGRERDRRRCRRDPDPRAADHGRGGVRRSSGGDTSAARTSPSSSSARGTS